VKRELMVLAGGPANDGGRGDRGQGRSPMERSSIIDRPDVFVIQVAESYPEQVFILL